MRQVDTKLFLALSRVCDDKHAVTALTAHLSASTTGVYGLFGASEATSLALTAAASMGRACRVLRAEREDRGGFALLGDMARFAQANPDGVLIVETPEVLDAAGQASLKKLLTEGRTPVDPTEDHHRRAIQSVYEAVIREVQSEGVDVDHVDPEVILRVMDAIDGAFEGGLRFSLANAKATGRASVSLRAKDGKPVVEDGRPAACNLHGLLVFFILRGSRVPPSISECLGGSTGVCPSRAA